MLSHNKYKFEVNGYIRLYPRYETFVLFKIEYRNPVYKKKIFFEKIIKKMISYDIIDST